jgi:hypothetical protein
MSFRGATHQMGQGISQHRALEITSGLRRARAIAAATAQPADGDGRQYAGGERWRYDRS